MDIKPGDYITFTRRYDKYPNGDIWEGPITNLSNLYIELLVTEVVKHGVRYETKPLFDYWGKSHHNCAYVNPSFFQKENFEEVTWAPFNAIKRIK